MGKLDDDCLRLRLPFFFKMKSLNNTDQEMTWGVFITQWKML